MYLKGVTTESRTNMFLRIYVVVLMAAGCLEYTQAMSVTCPTRRYTVILFQPVKVVCNYQTSASTPPIITWKYKSYCRDPLQAALNPSSAENILAQNNPNYDPNIECADSQRTVRTVASKQGDHTTLGPDYTGRKISIVNLAELNIQETAWGDSGIYECKVSSVQDLSGTSECYSEVLVLVRQSNTTDILPGIDLLLMEDWLLVLLVVLGFILLLVLIGICWCQCCPHTCCCYLRCPCCPERCCCPRALYEAGKAVKKGMGSEYAASQYAASQFAPMYAQPMYGGSQNTQIVPMVPLHNGAGAAYQGRDYDGSSSVAGSQVPLLHDQDGGGPQTRSGYRIQVDPSGNATRAIYYMEKELAALDPSRPANYSRLDNVSEVTSLHDGADARGRGGRSQPPALSTVLDRDEAMSTISSVSQQGRHRDDDFRPRGDVGRYGRARSMESLDEVGRRYRSDDRRPEGSRGRRGSDDEWSSSARSGYDERSRRDYSPDDRGRGRRDPYGGLHRRRSRSRDDITQLSRNRGGREDYDDSFLREAMERKRLGEEQRARSRERLDSDSDRGRGPRGAPPLPLSPPSGPPGRRDNYPPPQPPPYSDDESVSSSKRSNLRKNGAVSRESLVV